MNPQKLLRNIVYLLAGCFVLSVPFGVNEGMTNPLVNGKVYWFQAAILVLASAIIVFELIERKCYLRLFLPDWMIFFLLATILLTYDWRLNPDPTGLFYYVQVCVWWFLLRIISSKEPLIPSCYLLFILFSGCVQAIWGLVQIYNLADSNHLLFRLTGFFPNPGPYSGYLAMLLPVALGLALHIRKRKGARNVSYRFIRTIGWITCILILMVLPSGMSRSAWLAAVISSLWVFWKYRLGKRKVRILFKRRPFFTYSIAFLSMVLLVSLFTGLYYMKKDSADGRLLIWKVTSHVISENPVTGTGIGGFPAAFAKAQAAYLDSGTATNHEKWIAGCPETAFNEYLHILAELGVFGFLFFIVACGSVIYTGIKRRRYYVVGGIISLLIFACSSYPFHDPSFLPIAVLLSVLSIQDIRIREVPNRTYGRILVVGGVLVAGAGAYLAFQEFYRIDKYEQWTQAKVLYSNNAFQPAKEKYEVLRNELHAEPGYLFEYARCLGECGEHEEAIVLLERASCLSSDPMIHCMIGKNRMKTKDFEGAEESFLYALKILPERIYPYLLLSELYAHPENYNEEKFRMAADSVLYKRPKVESPAIENMRIKVNKLLQTVENR